jgi:hypothetical protein
MRISRSFVRLVLILSVMLALAAPLGLLAYTHVRANANTSGGASLTPAGGQFVSVPIVRVLDTRYGTGNVPTQPIAAGGTVTFPAAGVFSIPSNADAVVLDINAITPGASGFLSVYDADTADPGLAAVGLRAGEGTNQEATVPLSTSGLVSLTNHSAGTVDVAASVPGYYTGESSASTSSAGDTYVGVPWASPVINTSTGWNVAQAPIPAGGSLTFQVSGVGGIGSGADTAVLQVNAFNATASGYLTAYAAGASDPGVSALAYFSDDAYRNLVYAPLSPSGQATLANHGSAPVDVSVYARGAYLPPSTTPAGAKFAAVGPQFVYGAATAGAQLAAGASATFQVTGTGDIPAAGVAGVTEDVVVSNPTAMGRLDEGPAGGALQPVVSFLNADSAYAGYDNGMVSTLSPSGQQTITNESSGAVNVQVAVTGIFEAPVAPGEPLQVAATISGSSATVSWAAPADDGGSPVTGYTITAPADTASVQVGPTTYQATLSGLAQAATDTFTVTATNAVGPGMAGTASSDSCVPIDSESVSDADQAQALTDWTDAQVASSTGWSSAAMDAADQAGQIQPDATQASLPTSACSSLASTPLAAPAAGDTAALDPAASHWITGYPTVGKFVFKSGGFWWNCTGTVINDGVSGPKTYATPVVVTAAHCLKHVLKLLGRLATSWDLAFIPKWNNGKFPYGVWAVAHYEIDSRWIRCDVVGGLGCHENWRYDYAFLILKKDKYQHNVGYYTGADGWKVSMPPTINNTRIVGIPGYASAALVSIAQSTVDNETCSLQYRQANTPGFSDGASGGPWFWYFNTHTQRGSLLGDTGGCQDGSQANTPSYASIWHYDFVKLLAQARSDE